MAVGCSALSPASSSIGGPSCWAIPCSSRVTDHNPSMISPVHAATAPARIRVLPKLNSLTGIPKPIATRPANRQPIPAINITAFIKPTPGPRPQSSQPPNATIPSYCAPGQPAIAGVVPTVEARHHVRSLDQAIAALHQGIWATIANYLVIQL